MLGVYGLGIKERFIAPRRWPRCPLWARCSSLRCGNIAPVRGSAVVSLADGTVQAPGKPEKNEFAHREWGGWRCCQTNANQSLVGQWHCPLCRAEPAPFVKSGSAVQLEEVSGGEATLVVEVVENGGVDGGELLKTSHLPEPLHCSFSSS